MSSTEPIHPTDDATVPAAPHVSAMPLILVTVAAHMALFGMLTPVMALYAEGFGIDEWQIGLMITVFAAGRLLADIPAGHAASHVGLHAMLWGGPLLCGAGSVLGALATDYTTLLAGRGLQGIGSGLYMTAATIFCAVNSDRATRGRVMARFQAAMLVGAAFGPVAGGLAADAFGQSGPFWAAAMIGLATAAIAFAFFRDTPRAATPGNAHAGSGALLLIVPFACVLAVNFAIFLTRTAGQWQMMPLMAADRFGIGAREIGISLTLTALATLAVLPLAGWIVDRVSRPLVITVSLIGASATLMAIVLAPSVAMLHAGMIAMGITTGIGGPAVAAYAVDVSPEDKRGLAMGLMRFCGDLGYLVGPVSLGALVDVSGIGEAGGLAVNAAGLAALAGLFALVVMGRRR